VTAVPVLADDWAKDTVAALGPISNPTRQKATSRFSDKIKNVIF
jgi:hypothetical protein